jgi:hypothetical protein
MDIMMPRLGGACYLIRDSGAPNQAFQENHEMYGTHERMDQ